MDKQRLIDANALQKEFEWLESVVCSCRKDDVADSLQRVKNAQTIDPETLPIVQNLRKELARVTAERDAAVKDINEILSLTELCPLLCDWCRWNEGCDSSKMPEWRGVKEE